MTTWEEVLARKDLIGGEFESLEDGVAYRGPLESITLKGKTITFKSPWCARLDAATGRWVKSDITSSSVNTAIVTPQDIGHGRIFFFLPLLGRATIFPAGDSKLDPAEVEGLTLSDS